VVKVVSYNKYTGPYAAILLPYGMKLWNQNNETCRFQYDEYGEFLLYVNRPVTSSGHRGERRVF